jgi:hypothetical protein
MKPSSNLPQQQAFSSVLQLQPFSSLPQQPFA